ncbi:MAG: acylphosphatase [Bacteroidetes bacterium]|nr:acylphosphatase [Bacteroidota bacterium]
MIRSYKITVKGKVQRVSFRFFTQAQALKLSLTGLVRNLPNGDVYIEAEGEEDHINKLITWCDTGPPLAKVTEVFAEEQPLRNFQTFELKR